MDDSNRDSPIKKVKIDEQDQQVDEIDVESLTQQKI